MKNAGFVPAFFWSYESLQSEVHGLKAGRTGLQAQPLRSDFR
jgi:hypothetical protein